MKAIKKIIALAAAVSLLFALGGCGEKSPSPEDTINRFCEAVNGLDAEGARSGLCADWNEKIDAALSLFGGGDTQPRGFLKLALSLLAADGGLPGGEVLPRLDIKISEVRENGADAEAELRLALEWDETRIEREMRMELRIENGVWVICGVEEAGNGYF